MCGFDLVPFICLDEYPCQVYGTFIIENLASNSLWLFHGALSYVITLHCLELISYIITLILNHRTAKCASWEYLIWLAFVNLAIASLILYCSFVRYGECRIITAWLSMYLIYLLLIEHQSDLIHLSALDSTSTWFSPFHCDKQWHV